MALPRDLFTCIRINRNGDFAVFASSLIQTFIIIKIIVICYSSPIHLWTPYQCWYLPLHFISAFHGVKRNMCCINSSRVSFMWLRQKTDCWHLLIHFSAAAIYLGISHLTHLCLNLKKCNCGLILQSEIVSIFLEQYRLRHLPRLQIRGNPYQVLYGRSYTGAFGKHRLLQHRRSQQCYKFSKTSFNTNTPS